MQYAFLLISALLFYLIATITMIIATRQHNGQGNKQTDARLLTGFIIGALGLAIHLYFASQTSLTNGTLNVGLRSMVVVISSMVALIYLSSSLFMPIKQLGVLVFPFSIASLIFALFWNSPDDVQSHLSGTASVHILISILAYCFLALSCIQALLYVYQERLLRLRSKPRTLMALPPLQTMELLLFRLVIAGFFLLTLTLLSGAMFSHQIFGHAFVFKHHTILALLGWLAFAVLLYKRVRQGLRGSQAAIWIICGFLLIQLGYFGTKIVSESLALQ